MYKNIHSPSVSTSLLNSGTWGFIMSSIKHFKTVASIFEHFFNTVPLPPPERKLPKTKTDNRRLTQH